MDQRRRKFLETVLRGAGAVGLRGLVASLPTALLTAPEWALGQSLDPCNASTVANAAGGRQPQKIILITSASGDPLNANVPGTYEDYQPDVYHPAEASLPTGTFTSADGRSYKCAAAWANLPATMLGRTCFFHHATYSNAHGDHAKVNAYMGAIRRQELLVSLIARNIAACLGTTQAPPLLLSDVLIRYAGAVLPVLDRNGLYNILRPPTGGELTLRNLRDRDLASLSNTVYRPTATAGQSAALDRYLAAQTAARAMDTSLVGSLNTGNLAQTVAVLLRMNISPVVVLRLDFGGDNHRDGGLYAESSQTTAGVGTLVNLWNALVAQGIQDEVTIVIQNVFGRTLNAANRNGDTNGRDHNSAHHCSVLIGSGFRKSVIGGLTPIGNDFRAQAIDSGSGLPAASGDIPYEHTLASVAKTICAAVGLGRATADDQITKGRYVAAALAT
jgi:hypothetical protein